MRFEDLEVVDLNQDDNLSGDESVLKDRYSSRNKRERKKNYEEDEGDWKSELKGTLSSVLVAIVAVIILRTFVIVNAVVPTGSMENTIMPGDHLLGLRSACVMSEYERGDVIFFLFPDDEKQNYVKRIIGLPNEKVVINDGKIYINDSEVPLEEPYLKEKWITATGPYEFQIPPDSYLVLGDNRNASADARYWRNPYVTEDKIIGKAIFTYFPFDRWGFVE